MVAVATPLSNEPRRVIAWGLGFSAGALTAGLAVTLILELLHSAVSPVPDGVLKAACVAVCAYLAWCDLRNRTPSMMRQTPKSAMDTLPIGVTGFAWGLDLSLPGTTIRLCSLTWAALALAIMWPSASRIGGLAYAVTLVVGVGLLTVIGVMKSSNRPMACRSAYGAIARTSGGLLVGVAALLGGAMIHGS
jgi:hypothetical protein